MTTQLVTQAQSTSIAPSRPNPWNRWMRFWGMQSIPLEELRAKYETADSQYIEIDGTRVHYRKEGSGPGLLLLHGVLAHLQTWDGWVDELKKHYTVVRLDVPGFGLTGPMASGDYSPEYSLKFFEMMRQALGMERFSIVGNSLGGFLGWYYAAHYPQYVEKLILIDPLSYPQSAPPIMRFAVAPVIRNLAPFCVPRPFIHNSMREVYGDPSRITSKMVDRYHELLLREGNRQAMIDYFSKADDIFSVEADGRGKYSRKISDLKCPVMVMWGEDDAWLPASHVESFRKDLPDVHVKLYPNMGHVPMEEIPEITVRDAMEFLAATS